MRQLWQEKGFSNAKPTLFIESGHFIVYVDQANDQFGACGRHFLVVQLAVVIGDFDRFQFDHQCGLVIFVIQEACFTIQLISNPQLAIVLVQRKQIARIVVQEVGQFSTEINEL